MKRTLAIILSILMITTVLAGCGTQVVSSGKTDVVSKTDTDDNTTKETASVEAKSTDPLLSIDDVPDPDLSNIDADYQTAEPKEGDTIAILHTDKGDITFKFFPEVAPKAVANFEALAKDGRFDETIFHRITTVDTAGCEVIQAGDYTNYNGTGGVSAFGTSFGYEVSDYTLNIRGSVAMAHSSQPDSNGSQFYINTANNNALDGDYTVFAQVIDGMDVVDEIHSVKRDSSDAPVEPIYIHSVEITTYQ